MECCNIITSSLRVNLVPGKKSNIMSVTHFFVTSYTQHESFILILSIKQQTSTSMLTHFLEFKTVAQYHCGNSHHCYFIDITIICLSVHGPYFAMSWPVYRWRESRVGGLIVSVRLCRTRICFMTWKQRADKLMLLISSDSLLVCVQIAWRHHQLLPGLARRHHSFCAHLASRHTATLQAWTESPGYYLLLCCQASTALLVGLTACSTLEALNWLVG